MRIRLSPQMRPEPMTLARNGDTLVINGETFDFSPLGEGEALPAEAIASDLFLDPVTRVDGEIVVTIVLPHGPLAPPETLFPAEIVVTETTGEIALPPFGAAPGRER